MPRAILVPSGETPGVISYTSGASEEFALTALTVLITGASGQDDLYFLQCRTPAGGIIYQQFLGEIGDPPVWFSLSPDAEPWATTNSGQQANSWPQSTLAESDDYVTARMTPVSLTPGCSVNVIAFAGGAHGTDPFTNPDPSIVPLNLHLWVEDTGAVRGPPLEVLPPLLTHEPLSV